jgi:hypothetical protein
MRFEHEAGPGTVVMIGNRRWELPCDTADPKEIELLSKHPGVRGCVFDTTEIAQCTAGLIEAGLTPEEAELATPGVLDLAAADPAPSNRKKPPKEADAPEKEV